MATAVPTQPAGCPTTEHPPLAVAELSEAPDAARRARASQAGVATTVQVLAGIVYLVAGDDDWVLTPGDSATVAADTPYRAWNAGDDLAQWVELYCAA
jgi:hypothetical protein